MCNIVKRVFAAHIGLMPMKKTEEKKMKWKWTRIRSII